MVYSIFGMLSMLFGGAIEGDYANTQDSKPIEPSSNTFALIIGINKYRKSAINNLRGAVPDAEAMVEYLCERLHVPKNQIATLYDYTATRNNIIQAFQDLAADQRIKWQDAIIIFYAGHGGEKEPPAGWPTGNQKIQTLVPSDEGTESSAGKIVESISDYTLAVLLNRLAEAKGDNITVIFDSCHSSSGTRESNSLVSVRHVDSSILVPLQLATDQDILHSDARALHISNKQILNGARSHVLLAACGAAETAKEPDGRGAFTKALLDVLYNVRLDAVTYVGLMDRLCALPNQTPQCEGENRMRVMFDAKIASAERQFVRVLRAGGLYILQAGAAQGITGEAHFNIYGERLCESDTNPPLASFVVKSVGPFQSTLEPTVSSSLCLPDRLYARQTREGRSHQLMVFFTEQFIKNMDHSHHLAEWKASLGVNEGTPEFGYARTESEAGLVIGLENGRAVFDTRNELVTANGLTRIPHHTSPTAERVVPVIRAAAKWNWHVNRTSPNDPFDGKVWIEMTRLVQCDGNSWVPIGGNLNNTGTGIVNLTAGPEDVYGFKLVNESRSDLYPYLFHFDANDQSITPYYLGSYGGVAGSDPQLPGKGSEGVKARGELMLGYGIGGAPGLTMDLSDDEDHGVVIFKLFVTTRPTDFDLLPHESPFNDAGRKMRIAPGYETANRAEKWGTSLMIVSLSRKSNPTALPRAAVDTTQALQEHLIGRSQAPVLIRSSGLVQTKRSWFQTPPVSANRLAVINNMRLRTHARDQELYGGVKGASHSWFDVVVLDTKGNIKSSKSNRDPCVWKSHANKINSRDYVWIDGLVFDEHHEIWVNLEPGDSIQVVLNAQMNDCVNDAAEGHLMFW